ncbi:hypothetical protein HDE_04346 [Halotydeus destructor]|nr:hypothetical protein HDE_04346 [Halotydeus destructor]
MIETPEEISEYLEKLKRLDPAAGGGSEVEYDLVLPRLRANNGRMCFNCTIRGSLLLRFIYNDSFSLHTIDSHALEKHRLGSGPLKVRLPVDQQLEKVLAKFTGKPSIGLYFDQVVMMKTQDRCSLPGRKSPARCAHYDYLYTRHNYLENFEPCIF